MRNLTPAVQTIVVSNSVAAGETQVVCTAVDTLGFSGFRVIAILGALTAGQQTSLAAQSSLDNGATDAYALITGAATPNAADADSNKMLILEVFKGHKRFVKPVINRGTANAAITAVIVELFPALSMPVTQDATVSQSAIFNDPHVSGA